MMVLVVVSGRSKWSVETIADESLNVNCSATRWFCFNNDDRCELDGIISSLLLVLYCQLSLK